MKPKFYKFPDLKKGDSCFPSVLGAPGGLLFRLIDPSTNEGFEGMNITVQFKNPSEELVQTLSTDLDTDNNPKGIERLPGGWYFIKTFIEPKTPDVYHYDWRLEFPNGTVVYTATETQKIIQNISNATR